MTDWKPPTVALRATPGVGHMVTNYLEAKEAGVQRFNERLKELCEKLGETALEIRQSMDGLWVRGYHNTDQEHTPLPGWRKEKGSHSYVPAARSKAGKEQLALLGSYAYKYQDLPGLPWFIWGEGLMGTWTLEDLGKHGQFATITVPLGERSDSQTRMCDVDTNLWERVPLSTYHLAKEAQ